MKKITFLGLTTALLLICTIAVCESKCIQQEELDNTEHPVPGAFKCDTIQEAVNILKNPKHESSADHAYFSHPSNNSKDNTSVFRAYKKSLLP